MSSSDEAASAAPKGKAKPGNKRMSIERIYQKKTQLEHILLRPDTYIGSSESYNQQMWVYDEGIGFNFRDVSYVPGLYKIFDEILVNASDNKQRDPNMKRIKIDISPEDGKICIMNDGKGIPVEMHKEHEMFVPTLIFGHLLTSSNYDDSQKKVTGGRNGFGAKLCNVFSKSFLVETSSKSSGKYFKQEWKDNMSKAGKITTATNKATDFTRITFYPDLAKFGMTMLERDTVALMKRRAYDIAATSPGVTVELNGEKLPIKTFRDYCNLYINASKTDEADEENKKLSLVYEKVNPRWEIALGTSQKGFQQVSFVNSIATTKGGTHVDYVSQQVVTKILAACQKKVPKGGVEIKPAQVKQHVFLFINSLVENPAFDSQTKENMTLKKNKFGSTCEPSDRFMKDILKTGVLDYVMDWATTKSQRQLQQKSAGKKGSKIKGEAKLSDAKDAGTARSKDCTLILTEGDSAKTLAIAGLGVIGKDKFGVFPLRGKLLNVREASHKQIMENAELTSMVKILGLKYGKKYETSADIATMRYGKIMIMADQDVDGSHIKGLIINFVHHNWPSLLKMNFITQFITPIIRASCKGKPTHSFYSLPEFKEWKDEQTNIKQWNIKYYKGLGTSTGPEAKEYFSDMGRHKIRFRYVGMEDDQKIQMAFTKKQVEARKDWLTQGMLERRERRAAGESELYLYHKTQTAVTYTEFIDRELILFSNYDNERSIPCIMDGFKPAQRKVMFTCFKRNLKKEIKVAQLVGSASEISGYHHGEQSLAGTIVNLAQNFVGSNNLNLLEPNGQFGTRLSGGSDSAAPRYIFTCLSPLARLCFPTVDDNILQSIWDDNKKVEPVWYAPIIPMCLVNGGQGIGTGYSTFIPNFSVKEIIENTKRLIKGQEYQEMYPSYRNHTGQMVKVDEQKYLSVGKIMRTANSKFQILELPVGTWTQNYIEKHMMLFAEGNEKLQPIFKDYSDDNTDEIVKFNITAEPSDINKWEREGIHTKLKLTSAINLTNMVMHDQHGVLRKYESPKEVMEDFYPARLAIYVKRKDFLVGKFEAEANQLLNKARFIVEKIEGKIKVENVKHRDLIAVLLKRGFDSDPMKKWQTAHDKLMNSNPEEVPVEGDEEENSEEESPEENLSQPGDPNYDYLIDMSIRTLTLERKNALEKKRDEKLAELEELKNTPVSKLWLNDIKELEEGLKKYAIDLAKKQAQSAKRMKQTSTKKYVNNYADDLGEEVRFKVPIETVKVKREPKVKKEPTEPKAPKAPAVKKEKKEANGEPQPMSLADRMKKKRKSSPMKPKKNPWETDSEEDDDISDFSGVSGEESDEDFRPVTKKAKSATNGAALKLEPDISLDSTMDDTEDSFSLNDNKSAPVKKETISLDDTVSPAKPPPPPLKKAPENKAPANKAPANKAPAKKPVAKTTSKKITDFLSGDSDQELKKKAAPKKKLGPSTLGAKKPAAKAAPAKKAKSPWSDSDDESPQTSKKSKKKMSDSDGSDFDLDDKPVVHRNSGGRSRKTVKYTFGDSDESD
ncbi:DNA topoisomerase 2-alpha-like isoform X2 [Bolinopsis microptera]